MSEISSKGNASASSEDTPGQPASLSVRDGDAATEVATSQVIRAGQPEAPQSR